MLKLLAILLLCMFAGVNFACAQDAEKALKEFEGKVLVLRHPLHGGSQRYDAEGKVLKGGNEEPWTSHGGVLIERILLTPDKLRVDGKRMMFAFSKKEFLLVELKKLKEHEDPPFSPDINIEIVLGHSIDSEEQARNTLNKVFALSTEDLLAAVPDFWRSCLTDRLTYDPSRTRETEFYWRAPEVSIKRPVPIVDRKKPVGEPVLKSKEDRKVENQTKFTEDGEPLMHVGDGVSPPRPIHTPEPEYANIARYESFHGVDVVTIIVGTDGRVHKAWLARPLGLGLDESSIATVKTWRFQPAFSGDKEPVAVEINIEVSFNLY
ncbi:MAG TPA: energy transducer TonB [Candidatus Angelobacter sp.]|nr:energy transducer TonB [Candidatus Angelobacter sp.]